MMPPRPPRVYLVTDPSVGRGLVAHTAAALRGFPSGVVAVQLRARGATGWELLDIARALRTVVSEAGQLLLVNDRVDVVVAAGADGVHLPSAGIPPGDARRLVGSGRLVAVSCHSLADVEQARDAGADFATFGPIFDTPSKRGFGPPVGLGPLREASLLGLPLVGLGGVDVVNAPEVVAAGAYGVAAIRAWLDAPDPAVIVRQFLDAAKRRER
jgi:thiamine-phosphate pyrophosphorylase